MVKKPEIPYSTSYRDIKYPRLEFKTGTLLLVLPKNYEKEKALLQKHKKWIQRKNHNIQTALEQARTTQLNQTCTIEDLKTLTNAIVQQYQNELHTTTNKTFYRRMKTKWASLSKHKNLTINTLIRYLPESFMEYIIYHELTHAKHGKRHNKLFWDKIRRKYPDYQSFEKSLLAHWFQIQTLGIP